MGGKRDWETRKDGRRCRSRNPSLRTSYKEISRGRLRCRKLLRDILTAITVFLAILVADRRAERPDDKVKISPHKAKLSGNSTQRNDMKCLYENR